MLRLMLLPGVAQVGYRTKNKPINITRPEETSFEVENTLVSWQNWMFHVGSNYKEGIVLSNIT